MSGMKAAVVAVSCLVALTLWTAGLTLWQLKEAAHNWEPAGLFTSWEAHGLRVMGSDGRWMVTHLENVENRSIAKLPEPVWVVESGGVLLSMENLAKLEWKLPAGPADDVFTLSKLPPPTEGTKIAALYFKAGRTKFVER